MFHSNFASEPWKKYLKKVFHQNGPLYMVGVCSTFRVSMAIHLLPILRAVNLRQTELFFLNKVRSLLSRFLVIVHKKYINKNYKMESSLYFEPKSHREI